MIVSFPLPCTINPLFSMPIDSPVPWDRVITITSIESEGGIGDAGIEAITDDFFVPFPVSRMLP